MCYEIEAKLKVDSLAEVGRKLAEFGAEFLAEQLQSDFLFDDANAALTTTDRCLRLRRQSVGGDERFFLTYKGAKEESNFKKRQEIEIQVAEGDSTQKLLSALGYGKVMVIEKKRMLWKFGGCSVALDELPFLGGFVEIEGPDDESITEVQDKLGLDDLPHIPKSYAQLIKEQRTSNNA